MDDEARGSSYFTNPDYGKVEEPLLVFTRFIKTFHVRPLDGWKRLSDNEPVMNGVYWYRNPHEDLGQGALRSSSVFNFYDPEFIPSDPAFTANNVTAPELQIQTGPFLAKYFNLIFAASGKEKNAILENNASLADFAAKQNQFREVFVIANGDFSNFRSTAIDVNGKTPRQLAIAALINHLDNLMFAGAMPVGYMELLKTYLNSLTFKGRYTDKKRARLVIKEAVQMLASTSEYKILK